MRAVGYRQAWRHLEGEIGEKELRETGIAATRQLAKRQLTWLRSLPGIEPAARLAEAISRG
jgi:tRNA dimethylallyltransferase